MVSLSGVTLRAACVDLGLLSSGTKRQIANRLLDSGMTAESVQDRYGWKARSR